METQKSYYITTEKMSVGYDGKPLIEEVEIMLRKGEILTLLGPNGAGKSTILKSIARQLSLIAGTVRLDGEDMKSLTGAELSKKMAVVMTKRLRAELMTCEDVVATGRYPYTGRFGVLSAKDHEAVQEAMEAVHVLEFKDRDFARISDGQRQRILLARAICQQPEILLLDEPTSYLDIKYKLEFLSVLQELQKKKGLTVILSLHELELAARVSDRILCVDGAFVEQVGTPEEIFRPGHLSKLFQITQGSFEEESQEMELAAVKGTPEVFVIAGNGSGRNTFRRLQREGIPFAAGLLWENDLDYPAAKALSSRLFSAPAFEPVSEELLEQAMRCMDGCRKVICCRESFGTLEDAQKRLLAYAKARGLSERDAQNCV